MIKENLRDRKALRKALFNYIVEFVFVAVIMMVLVTIEEGGISGFIEAFPLCVSVMKVKIIGFAFLVTVLTFMIRFTIRMPEGKEKNLAKDACFIAAVLVAAVYVFATYLLKNNYFVFLDIGTDTKYQYYPLYLSAVRMITEGDLTAWNWTYGLGVPLLNNLSQLLEPFGFFTILTGVIFGASTVRYTLGYMQVVRVLLCAIFCKMYLKRFNLHDIPVYFAAFLYAFNGYLMVWGQHYMLGSMCMYLPLLLYFIEKFLNSDKVRYVIYIAICVFFLILGGFYTGYMALLFTAGYFLFRVFNPEIGFTWRERLGKMWKCLAAVVSGLLMVGVELVPIAYYLMFTTQRFSYQSTALGRFISEFFTTFSWGANLESLGRLISNNLFTLNEPLEVGWPNYYEMPNLCISAFIYLFLAQFIVQTIKRCDTKKKRIYWILVAITVLLLFFNPGVTLAFNGFTYSFARYTFVTMPLQVLMIAIALERIVYEKEISLGAVIGGGIFTFIIIELARTIQSYEVVNSTTIIIISVSVGIVIFLWFYLAKEKGGRKSQSVILSALLLCTLITVSVDNHFTNDGARAMPVGFDYWDFSGGVIDDTATRAMDYIESIDDSFYRMEKLYVNESEFGDPVAEGYSSMTGYNSTDIDNTIDFFTNLCYTALNGPAVRFFNNYGMGSMGAADIINIKYILTQYELNYDWAELLTMVDDKYLYRNTEADQVARFSSSIMSESEASEYDGIQQREIVKNTVIIDDEDIDTVTEYLTGVEALDCDDAGSVGSFVRDGDAIEGTVTCNTKGVLMISIPDTEGWTYYVNGVEADTVNADYGFVGILLDEGTYTVRGEYHIPCLKLGIICSIVGLLCTTGLGLCLYMYSKKSKKKTAW